MTMTDQNSKSLKSKLSGSDLRKTVESEIARLYNYEQAVLFGRARSGLAAIIDTLNFEENFPFLIPSNICPIIAAVAKSCGAEIILCDIESDIGQPTDTTFSTTISKCSRPGIVMPAHLYGYVRDYPKTQKIARANGWFILENDSTFSKASFPAYEQLPAFGDAVLVSFGDGKTLTAGGGGAVVVNDPGLASDLKRKGSDFSPLSKMAEDIDDYFNSLVRSLRTCPDESKNLSELIEQLLPYQETEFRYGFPESLLQSLHAALKQFPRMAMERRKKADLWCKHLAGLSEKLVLPDHEQPVPWRYMIRLGEGRDRIVSGLRAANIDAGTNYPPLTEFFPSLRSKGFYPGGETWMKEVINLWVTEEYDEAEIMKAANIIKTLLTNPNSDQVQKT
jgi:dTDP-4-amino-4,6-dideoxygalactose transaminase